MRKWGAMLKCCDYSSAPYYLSAQSAQATFVSSSNHESLVEIFSRKIDLEVF